MNTLKMEKLGKQSSIIRELFEYGKERKKLIGEDKVFDFSIGNPSVPTPEIVNRKLVEIIQNTPSTMLHGYTSSAGNIETRDAIAEHLNKTFGVNERGKYIYLTVGAAAGLSISFAALLNPGDEVIVFAPFWPEYRVLVEKAGGKLVVVEPNDDFTPDFSDLESKINEKTKIVILNNPNNPTGVLLNSEIISKLARLLKQFELKFKHSIYLLSDEPYRELIFNGEKYPFITKYYDNSIVTYSFSKSLSLPGERIGYILVGSGVENKDDIFACVVGAGRALGFVCATSLFQHLIPCCLGITSDLSIYKENRDYLYSHLTELGYEVIKPDGAFYLFVKALEKDANKFSFIAKKFELLLVPSDSFGINGYVRIAYCVSPKQVKDSIPAFKALKDYYKGE